MKEIEVLRGAKHSAKIILDGGVFEVLYGAFRRNAHGDEEFVLTRAIAPKPFVTLSAAQRSAKDWVK